MKNALTEKYRPKSLNDIIGQKASIGYLQSKIKSQEQLPHLLFPGVTPGIGKTTTAMVLARELSVNMLEMNASDDRGIDSIRKKVKEAAQTKGYFGDGKRKIIFLDEADGLTPAAQDALRRIMEEYEDNCMFILCCNHINMIIEAIQSRCTVLRFGPLEDSEIEEYIRKVMKAESIELSESLVKKVVSVSGGSPRNAIHSLDLARHSSDSLEHQEDPYDAFAKYYQRIKSGTPITKVAESLTFKVFRGYAYAELVESLMYHVSEDISIPQKIQVRIIEKLGECLLVPQSSVNVKSLVYYTVALIKIRLPQKE